MTVIALVRRASAAVVALLAIAAITAPLAAQERERVNVGTITSTQTCTYFRNYSGSRLEYGEEHYARLWGLEAGARYYAAHTTWRSWVVKDCQTNFQTLRSAVEGALASTGRLTTGRGGYTLDITISNIGETARPRTFRSTTPTATGPAGAPPTPRFPSCSRTPPGATSMAGC